MHCTLLIPHLFWSREAADRALRDLAVPALVQLLARSDAQRYPPIATEAWLCQAWEVERQSDWPVAPLTLAIDGGLPGAHYWLRADPVHIKVERDRLTLIESVLFDLTQPEAQSLAAALDGHFAAEGVNFSAPAPQRWYARFDRKPELITHSAHDVAGADVQKHLPLGADALAFHRLHNEVQMLLHDHPVNEQREARGELPVNSVWFWGGGYSPPVPGKPFAAVWSDDVTAVALGAAADAHAVPLPIDAAAWCAAQSRTGFDTHLIVLDELSAPAAYGDLDSWRERITGLERRWFVPLLRLLREGQVNELTLIVPGRDACHRFELARMDLLKLWRRPKPLAAYA